MVAKGIFEPQKSFFFIHVPIAIGNKREKYAANDPVGQLLTTLFAAQLLNKESDQPDLFNHNKKNLIVPMYGSYIMGRSWYFLRLKDTEYHISKAYDSTDPEDLNFILKLLKAQKEMIISLFKS